MMEQIERLKSLMLDQSPDYGDNLNTIINNYNISIDAFVNSLTHSTLIQLLIDKGLINETEYTDTMNRLCENSSVSTYLEKIEKTYDMIVELIESEKSYLEDAASMYANLDDSNVFSSEEASSDIIDDIFNSSKE